MRPSTFRLSLVMCLAACAGGGCNPPAAPQPDKPPTPQTTAMAQSIHAPLDRAKAVEGRMQEAKTTQDRQIAEDTQ